MRDCTIFVDASFARGIGLFSIPYVSITDTVIVGNFAGILCFGCNDVFLKNLTVNNANDCFNNVSVTNLVAENCVAINGVSGFSGTCSGTFKNCVASSCVTGFNISATSLGRITIKDSLFCLNSGAGISGSNLVILDTRSGTPMNGLADNIPGALVITY